MSDSAALSAAEARIRELELEIKSGDEMYEAQQQKFDGCPHKPIGPGYNACGCSHDKIGDVCGLHSPALRAAQTRVRELEQALRKYGRAYLEAQLAQLQARNQEMERLLQLVADYDAPISDAGKLIAIRNTIRAALAHKPSPEVKP